MEPISQAFAFVLELEKLKSVQRRIKPLGQQRHENAAEHSWQVCLLAYAMLPYADEPVAIDRVIKMLLLHDVVEIDTGDTFVYDNQGRADIAGAEQAAARRIFGLLPEPQAGQWLALWLEYEDRQTPEAVFANAMDRLMPVLQNLHNDGQSWREHGVCRSEVLERNAIIAKGSPATWALLKRMLDDAVEKGWLKPE